MTLGPKLDQRRNNTDTGKTRLILTQKNWQLGYKNSQKNTTNTDSLLQELFMCVHAAVVRNTAQQKDPIISIIYTIITDQM